MDLIKGPLNIPEHHSSLVSKGLLSLKGLFYIVSRNASLSDILNVDAHFSSLTLVGGWENHPRGSNNSFPVPSKFNVLYDHAPSTFFALSKQTEHFPIKRIKENWQHDHIAFSLDGDGNPFLSVYVMQREIDF